MTDFGFTAMDVVCPECNASQGIDCVGRIFPHLGRIKRAQIANIQWPSECQGYDSDADDTQDGSGAIGDYDLPAHAKIEHPGMTCDEYDISLGMTQEEIDRAARCGAITPNWPSSPCEHPRGHGPVPMPGMTSTFEHNCGKVYWDDTRLGHGYVIPDEIKPSMVSNHDWNAVIATAAEASVRALGAPTKTPPCPGCGSGHEQLRLPWYESSTVATACQNPWHSPEEAPESLVSDPGAEPDAFALAGAQQRNARRREVILSAKRYCEDRDAWWEERARLGEEYTQALREQAHALEGLDAAYERRLKARMAVEAHERERPM